MRVGNDDKGNRWFGKGHNILRRGGAYPKGTGSTYRSCFAVCRWRCSARAPAVNGKGADRVVRPYEGFAAIYHPFGVGGRRGVGDGRDLKRPYGVLTD